VNRLLEECADFVRDLDDSHKALVATLTTYKKLGLDIPEWLSIAVEKIAVVIVAQKQQLEALLIEHRPKEKPKMDKITEDKFAAYIKEYGDRPVKEVWLGLHDLCKDAFNAGKGVGALESQFIADVIAKEVNRMVALTKGE
jgi:hypothetical protein